MRAPGVCQRGVGHRVDTAALSAAPWVDSRGALGGQGVDIMRALVLGGAAVATAIAIEPLPADENINNLKALGQHLAQECTPCHRLDGQDSGIPPIAGLAPEYFIETMSFYKNGQRNNPAMVSVAQSLDDRQIKALAQYFATLPQPEAPPAPSTMGSER
jgi:cytochrome c553